MIRDTRYRRRFLLFLLGLAAATLDAGAQPPAHAQTSSFPYRLGAITSDTSGTIRLDPYSLAGSPLAGASLGRVDLSERLPKIGDQGDQNSCVGWAVAYYTKAYQEAVEELWPAEAHKFSPAWIYNQINGGRDEGATLRDALRVVLTGGAAQWEDFPYDERDFRRQPGDDVRNRASRFRASAFGRLWGSREEPDLNGLRQALAVGEMPIVGVEVHDNPGWRGTGRIDTPTPGDSFRGRHALALVGFDDDRRLFKFANSWGNRWGEEGFGYLSYDFVSAGHMSEAWLLTDARNEPAPQPTPQPLPSSTPAPQPTATVSPPAPPVTRAARLAHSDSCRPAGSGSNRHLFRVWIDASAAELDQIDHVTYQLHETFYVPIRTSSARAAGFGIEFTAWGQFTITAEVAYRAGGTAHLRRYLAFQRRCG